MQAGAQAQLPAEYPERAAYVAHGASRSTAATFGAGPDAGVRAGRAGRVHARDAGARVMLLGGEPVGERFIEWNFVSSSKERIEQAKADWRAGRMKLPDLDNEEFIPLAARSAAAREPDVVTRQSDVVTPSSQAAPTD